MEQNNVDISPEIGYNVDNEPNVEVVKMDEQSPVNDTECRHETLIPYPDDALDNGAIFHGCVNQKCGVGFYILPKPK